MAAFNEQDLLARLDAKNRENRELRTALEAYQAAYGPLKPAALSVPAPKTSEPKQELLTKPFPSVSTHIRDGSEL